MKDKKNEQTIDTRTPFKEKAKKIFKIILRVLRWIFAIISIILIFANIALWVLLLLLVLLTISWVHKQIEKIIPRFKRFIIKLPVFLILIVSFVLLLSLDSNNLGWDTVKVWEINIQQWAWDPDFVRDYSYHMVMLAEAYRDAYLLESLSFEIQWWDMTSLEYEEMLSLIYTKWDKVEKLALWLDQFIDKAPDELVYINLQNNSIFPQTLALGLSTQEMMWEEIMRIHEDENLSVPGNERMLSEKESAKIIKNREKAEYEKREKCDAIKQASPKKSWIQIVKETFSLDSGFARMRARERHQAVLKETNTQIEREDTKEKYYIMFQNWIKIWVFVAGAPVALAAWGGVLAASSLFIGWVDVGIAVGKSIDIVFNGKDPTQLKKDRETMDNTVGTISMFTNVASLHQNKWARDAGNHIFVSDVGGKFLRGTYDYVMDFKPDESTASVYISDDGSKLNYGNKNWWYWNQYLPSNFHNNNNQGLSSDESLQITLNAIKAAAQKEKDAGTFKKVSIEVYNISDSTDEDKYIIDPNFTDWEIIYKNSYNYQELLDNVYTQTDDGIKRVKDTNERKDTQEAVDSYQWEEIDWDALFKKSEAIFD